MARRPRRCAEPIARLDEAARQALHIAREAVMNKAAPTQKTILITGAASGIGRAVAQLFAGRGWFAGLADVDEAGLAKTAAEMAPGSHVSLRLDVRDRGSWNEALSRFAEAADGRMHVLFNNAGIARGGAFEDVAPELADEIVDVNFKGVLNGVYCALPMLKATPGARIVNVASASAIYGAPGFAVYSATKFAVRALTEALDIEFERHGVRVTSLMPWFIETPILDTVPANANMSARERLKQQGVPIYPVSLAAERAWEAAHGGKTHYLVGRAAESLSLAARLAPGFVKSQLRKLSAPIRSPFPR
jgi:NAD(P)-dependent dehydrogenase (short-subunit alcohol dehydrogenase family)